MNGDTKLILDKIDDLKEFYEREVNHLKEFYTATRLDMKEDVEEIKQGTKNVSEKVDTYITNHYSFHRREKKKFLKWILVGGTAVFILVFSGVGELLLPCIVSLAKLLWLL